MTDDGIGVTVSVPVLGDFLLLFDLFLPKVMSCRDSKGSGVLWFTWTLLSYY